MHPVDQTLTIYRHKDGDYGKPDIHTTTGSTPVSVVEGLQVDWTFIAR